MIKDNKSIITGNIIDYFLNYMIRIVFNQGRQIIY